MVQGTLDVSTRNDIGTEVVLRTARAGEVIGEASFLTALPRAESVTAVTESELLCLATEDLAAFRSGSPQLSAALEALRLERAESCVVALRAARR